MSVAPVIIHQLQPPVSAPARVQNPVRVYLAGMQSPRSRITNLASLERVGAVLGYEDPEACPWWELRYVELQALQVRLSETIGPKGEPLSPNYVNKLMSAVRGVLKTCWRLGLLSGDEYQRAIDFKPVRGCSLPAGRALSGGEVQALVAICQADPSPAGTRDAVIFGLGFAAGLRRAEMVALNMDDYDAETGAIEVRAGKGRKARRTFAPAGLQAALADWLAVRGDAPSPLLCPVDKAGTIVIRRCADQIIYAVCQKRAAQAGIAEFAPHDMRRTFAGDLIERTDLVNVQRLMGHSSPTTTASYDRRPERARKIAAESLHFPYVRRSVG